MTIENTIKNMEEALEKKKAVMRAKSVTKVAKLKERIKTKNEKIERLTKERDALETEVADLASDENVSGTVTKTEPFVPTKEAPAGDQKNDNKKTPPAKKK